MKAGLGVLVAAYWVNHHHLLFANRRIGWEVLWANLLWLFCLSLFPFAAAYLSQSRAAPAAVELYGALGAITSLAFLLLGTSLSRHNHEVAVVRKVLRRRQLRVLLAAALNLGAVVLARRPPIALLLLALPVLAYLVPERAVERSLHSNPQAQ